jgi:hypothetical protein
MPSKAISLPKILTKKEVKKLLDTTNNLKQNCILPSCTTAGTGAFWASGINIGFASGHVLYVSVSS